VCDRASVNGDAVLSSPCRRRGLRIGLTGGIASGKSTAAAILRTAGCEVFSADQAARAVLAPGSRCAADVAARFPGAQGVAGQLDRPALARVVFSDPVARAALEAILHPRILHLLNDQMESVQVDRPGLDVVVEAPLLFEAGMQRWFSVIVALNAAPAQQAIRLQRRDGIDAAAAQARIRAQMPSKVREARSDIVISNDGDYGALAARMIQLLSDLRAGMVGQTRAALN